MPTPLLWDVAVHLSADKAQTHDVIYPEVELTIDPQTNDPQDYRVLVGSAADPDFRLKPIRIALDGSALFIKGVMLNVNANGEWEPNENLAQIVARPAAPALPAAQGGTPPTRSDEHVTAAPVPAHTHGDFSREQLPEGLDVAGLAWDRLPVLLVDALHAQRDAEQLEATTGPGDLWSTGIFDGDGCVTFFAKDRALLRLHWSRLVPDAA